MFSTGGDEVNIPCYKQDEKTMGILKTRGITLEQALSEFVVQTQEALGTLGKTPVVWEGTFVVRERGGSNPVV